MTIGVKFMSSIDEKETSGEDEIIFKVELDYPTGDRSDYTMDCIYDMSHKVVKTTVNASMCPDLINCLRDYNVTIRFRLISEKDRGIVGSWAEVVGKRDDVIMFSLLWDSKWGRVI